MWHCPRWVAAMGELIDQLPREERRTLHRMAEAAGAPLEVVAVQVLRAYLRLASDCPAALPADPLAAMASRATGGRR